MFRVDKKSKKSNARLTTLETPHGKIEGPFFMAIGTRGVVKNVSVDELKKVGTKIILSNTYHLFLRPGVTLLKKAQGLHRFMNWDRIILTDSGGYQVFSLAKHRKIERRGVWFSDPRNGKKIFLSPEKVMEIQKAIGSDVFMVLDECPPYPCSYEYARKSLELTHEWAERSLKKFHQLYKNKKNRPLLFGIVQGSNYKDLRTESVNFLSAMPFDGYSIGGTAVGEGRQRMKEVLDWIVPHLPEDKPRYLMGLGRPEELVFAVMKGIDMFDCVIPTREARHGRLYFFKNEEKFVSLIQDKNDSFYSTLNITNKKFQKDMSPINHTTLSGYSKAYLYHLFKIKESMAMNLATLHNIEFYLKLMEKIRFAISRNYI